MQDFWKARGMPPTVQLSERRHRFRHRQFVGRNQVARGDETPKCRGNDDLDPWSATFPCLLGNASVHVPVEPLVCGQELPRLDGSGRAFLEDFGPKAFQLLTDRDW